MITLGNPEWRGPGGVTQEIQLIRNGLVITTIHGDLIKKGTVERGVTGTALMILNLASSSPCFRSLPDDVQLALWAITPEHGRIRMGIGQIDFWNLEFDQTGEKLEIHVRGRLAPLIDNRLYRLFKGELADLLANVCLASGPIRIEGLDDQPIEAYVNSASAYSAVRLLGASFGFIITENPIEDIVSLLSTSKALAEQSTRPIRIIDSNQIIGGTMRRGTPIRKRKDQPE